MAHKHAHRWFWSGVAWECHTCPEARAWNSPEERDRLMRATFEDSNKGAAR